MNWSIVFFALITMTVFPHLSANAADGWQPLPPLPQELASMAIAADNNGTVIIAGGSYWVEGERRLSDAVLRIDQQRSGWKQVGCLPAPRAYFGSADDGTALWLVGGITSEGIDGSICRVELTTGATRVIGSLPKPRSHSGAATDGRQLWVLGGLLRDGAVNSADSTFLAVDLATGAVERLASPPVPNLVNPSLVLLEGTLWVFAGSVWSTENQLLERPTTLLSYDLSSGAWSTHPWPASLPRALGVVPVSDATVLLGGGISAAGIVSRSVWRYDIRTQQLQEAAPLPQPLLAFGWARVNGHIVLAGGEPRPRSRTAQVHSLAIPDSNTHSDPPRR